jgi:uncharacterized protein CbrC (UPF0167 family)
MTDLPSFRYHPDPLATGSVIAARDMPCLCCNRIRPEAIDAVRALLATDFDLEGDEIDEFIGGLDKDGEPTAYIFRCLHCARPLAAVDES